MTQNLLLPLVIKMDITKTKITCTVDRRAQVFNETLKTISFQVEEMVLLKASPAVWSVYNSKIYRLFDGPYKFR